MMSPEELRAKVATANVCGWQQSGWESGYVCTRDPGHGGPHVAGGPPRGEETPVAIERNGKWMEVAR